MSRAVVEEVNNEKLYQLAQQLRCPEGEEGLFLGEIMGESNGAMIKESMVSLQLSDKNRILELGHGGCSHLSDLMREAYGLKYFGMEISKTMKLEAERINSSYVKEKIALFQLYDGYKVPYVLNFFDRIITVNTIYFWEQPLDFLKEIYRVLKPNGIFVMSFAKEEFMKKLPFVSNTDIFRLYDNQKIEELISKTNFTIENIQDKKEKVKSKTGEWVNGEYSIVVLSKEKYKTN